MSTTTTEPPDGTTTDGPLLDLTDAGVKRFIKQAKARGYVTMDELNKVLPSEEVTSEAIEDTLAMLSEMGVNVVEAEEDAENAEGGEVAVREETAVAEAADKQSAYDRTDDPVRMYLREMGSVELLSREGEIAIAKRIEAGREAMIAAKVSGLSHSPLIIMSRPASMRLAMAISPSRDSSSTLPISRRYMRTGSSVRPTVASSILPVCSSSASSVFSTAATGASPSSWSSLSTTWMPISDSEAIRSSICSELF